MKFLIIYGDAIYERQDEVATWPGAPDYPDGSWLVSKLNSNKGNIVLVYFNMLGSWSPVNDCDIPNNVLTWMLLEGM